MILLRYLYAADFAPILQQVEGYLGKVDAAGSNPARSSIKRPAQQHKNLT